LGAAPFVTTNWSLVLAAGREEPEGASEAMERLCRAYWYPLYAFARRYGFAPHDAQDLTQSFFVHILESNLVGKAQREKGKFRSFLLVSLKHFMASERDHARAQKRGGGLTFVFLDESSAEGRFANEPRDGVDPEALYERAWALAVLEQALDLLEATYAASGRQPLFEALQGFLLGERGSPSASYAAVAEGLGTSEGAVKMMVQRLRHRYRDCLRTVVAGTVTTLSEIDGELRHLVRVLRG
jgi:RNA polymerase sigma-70 factor (ECF subfamily)